MLKRGRITPSQARGVVKNYERIPIRFVEVSLDDAIEVAAKQNIHAYDACVIVCARQHRCHPISLDKGLIRAAIDAGVGVMEVPAQ
jgi:predicted nucleic acid-binding protein